MDTQGGDPPMGGAAERPAGRWPLWGLALLAALAVGLLEALQLYIGTHVHGRPLTWTRSMSSTIPSWIVLALLVPAVIALARRFPLDGGQWRRNLPLHLFGAVCFFVVHIGLASLISDYVLHRAFPLAFLPNLFRLFSLYFVVELCFYFGIIGIWYASEYHGKYRDRERAAAQLELRASRLEASLAQANLQALRMQLHPHFLFNTLNAVSVLALKGERHGVVRMLTRLSDLLRVALENETQVVSLREELDFLQRYLDIEEVRFKDRLSVGVDVEPAALDGEVPTLLLQPLVENAIGHGIAKRTGPGRIRITGRRSGGRLVLEVRDTGPGFPPEQLAGGGGTPSQAPQRPRPGGVGLANTRARLEQLYGSAHDLVLENGPEGGAVVRISVPYRDFGETEDGRAAADAVRSA
jgi:two-component system, LytTR family, sensor kinase